MIDIDGTKDTRYTHFAGKNPKFAQHLRTWGKAGTVTLKSKATPKLADRGMHCMSIGYALDHEGDCYHMWNPKTNRVHETRCVVWLKRMFYETVEGDQLASPTLKIDADNDEPDIEIRESGGDETVKDDDNEEDEQQEQEEQNESEEELDDEETALPMQTRSSKKAASRGTTRSGTQLALDPGSAGLLTIEDIEILNLLQELKNIEFGCVGAGLGGGFKKPMNYIL